MNPANGRCLCGDVEFSAQLPSKWVAHCHCTLEQGLVTIGERAVALGLGLANRRIGLAGASLLPIARGHHPRADRQRVLAARRIAAHFVRRQARHRDLQVDAVEQRPGQARAVP